MKQITGKGKAPESNGFAEFAGVETKGQVGNVDLAMA